MHAPHHVPKNSTMTSRSPALARRSTNCWMDVIVTMFSVSFFSHHPFRTVSRSSTPSLSNDVSGVASAIARSTTLLRARGGGVRLAKTAGLLRAMKRNAPAGRAGDDARRPVRARGSHVVSPRHAANVGPSGPTKDAERLAGPGGGTTAATTTRNKVGDAARGGRHSLWKPAITARTVPLVHAPMTSQMPGTTGEVP